MGGRCAESSSSWEENRRAVQPQRRRQAGNKGGKSTSCPHPMLHLAVAPRPLNTFVRPPNACTLTQQPILLPFNLVLGFLPGGRSACKRRGDALLSKEAGRREKGQESQDRPVILLPYYPTAFEIPPPHGPWLTARLPCHHTCAIPRHVITHHEAHTLLVHAEPAQKASTCRLRRWLRCLWPFTSLPRSG